MESQSAVAIRDILSYSFVSQPRFAPAPPAGADRPGEAARPLAFRVHSALYEDNRYATDLWLVWPGESASGESGASGAAHPGPTRLTSCGRVGVYVWEDDHTLLFSSDRAADDQKKREEGEPFTQFYRIDVTGGEATSAFRTDFPVKDLRVLRDGRILLLGTYDHVSPDDRKDRKDAAVTILNEIPWWSNGGGFTSDTRSALWLRDAEGVTTRLTPEDMAVDAFEASAGENSILYAGLAYRGKREVRNDLYLLDLHTLKSSRMDDSALDGAGSGEAAGAAGETGTVGAPPREYERPVFAGPGRAVVLVNRMARYGLNENPEFAEIDLKAGTVRLLTRELDRPIANTVGTDCRYGAGPAPLIYDDDYVYFISTEGTASGLRRLRVDTGEIQDVYVPTGSIDGYDIAGGRVVTVELRADALHELYAFPLPDTGGVNPSRLSSFNVDYMVTRRLSRPEPLSVTREDGTEIHGFVLAPPAAEPAGGSMPGILAIHGGPKTVYGEVFNHEMQTLAHAGYYVFFCNPRGSDGRGNAFADIRGRYGTIDYEDLMAFTDEVLRRYKGRIDPDRLGVMGGSYGGFMTNWIVGSTDRFAAAVSQRSISSWLSMWGTSDIGFYFTEDQIAGDPWEGREALWRQSPLRLAPQVKTPLLLVHSRQDYRCWEVEAFQLFTAIRYHGGDARLALFDGETHELSRSGKPKPRIRRLEEIIEWFNERLTH